MTAQDSLNRTGPMIDSLNAAIRENPLAAGLIGAGVAWMLMGGAKGLGVMAGIATAAAKAGSAAATEGNAAARMSKASANVATGVKHTATEVAGSIVPDLSVSDIVDEARSASEGRVTFATVAGRKYGTAVQSRPAESFERQPLLLSAIGIAIGAGMASAFAITPAEREWMGEQAATAREKLQGLTTEATERAQHVVAEVKDEADKQGLTPDAAKNAAAAFVGKVKGVVMQGPQES
jgi:hypothetical protein